MKDATLCPSDSCVGDLAEGLGGEPGGEDAGDPVAAALVTDPARGAVQPRVIAADVLLPATQYSTVQYSTVQYSYDPGLYCNSTVPGHSCRCTAS